MLSFLDVLGLDHGGRGFLLRTLVRTDGRAVDLQGIPAGVGHQDLAGDLPRTASQRAGQSLRRATT